MKTRNIRRNRARQYCLRYQAHDSSKLNGREYSTRAVVRWMWHDWHIRGLKRARSASRFNCLDCKVNTLRIGEYYVVQDHVWKSVAGLGMLCLSCLEKRLKRKLDIFDFKDAPVNYHGFKSELFINRFFGDPEEFAYLDAETPEVEQ